MKTEQRAKSEAENFIIDRPDLVPPGQKLTAWGVTLFFWGSLLYLWQPLISLVAWGLNIRLFYYHMILLEGYHTFLELLAFYLEVIALLGGGLILWGRINLWRFRGRERRVGIGHTNVDAMCATFNVAPRLRQEVLALPVVAVSFDEAGQIAAIAAPDTGVGPVYITKGYESVPTTQESDA